MADTNAAFWASPAAEPKRSYKYLVKWIGAGEQAKTDIPWFLVSSVDMPKAKTGVAETHALNHTFKWPGRITWEDINMEITDSEALDCANVIVEKLIGSGYAYPETPNVYRTISKQGAIAAFGNVKIQEITWDEKLIGEWELRNAWVNNFEFGKKAYESDDVQKITMSITYDWAKYTAYDDGLRPNLQEGRLQGS
jgi:hypothetical protein